MAPDRDLWCQYLFCLTVNERKKINPLNYSNLVRVIAHSIFVSSFVCVVATAAAAVFVSNRVLMCVW